jgi:murein DD-endopeptidase MepM/ murein hydrolase activator NlpD
MPRIWQSQQKVITPGGVGYVCIEFGHDNNPPYSTVGSTVKQGQLIGHTGTAGMVTGDHVHIDQVHGTGKTLVDYGIVCSGGNECWALDDSVQPTDIFYINDTTIINSMGLPFQTYDGGTPGPGPGPGPGPEPEFSSMPFIYYTLKRR